MEQLRHRLLSAALAPHNLGVQILALFVHHLDQLAQRGRIPFGQHHTAPALLPFPCKPVFNPNPAPHHHPPLHKRRLQRLRRQPRRIVDSKHLLVLRPVQPNRTVQPDLARPHRPSKSNSRQRPRRPRRHPILNRKILKAGVCD